MPGNTTQFIFLPDVAPNNRKYLVALASGFFTFCLGCTALSILFDVLIAGVSNPLTILGSPVIFIGALLPNILIALAIPWLQRYQRTHRYILIGAFLAGAIIAIPPALVFNTALSIPAGVAGADLLFMGTVPGIVEEGIKGLLLLGIFLHFRDEYHDPVDGIVLGALIGLGFAMTEDISYFLRGFAEGGPFGFIFTFILRVLFGWMNHSVFTAITGAALGFARMGRPGPRRWLLGIGGYACAAGLHNTFNLSATLLGRLGDYAILGIFPLYGMVWFVAAVLGFVVLRGWHQQAAIVRDELRDEVGARIVTQEEYVALPNPARRRELLTTALRHGKEARRTLGKRFQLQINLALQKRHTAYGDRPKIPQLHSEEALRERILRLGAEPRVAGGPVPLPISPGGFAAPPPPGVAPGRPVAGAMAPYGGMYGGGAATSSQPASAASTAVPDAGSLRLVVTGGEQIGSSIALKEGVTIGRSPARAAFALRDDEVSSLHARIERDVPSGRLALVDLDSTNGTFVNGQRITRHCLSPGDQVRLGQTLLRVERGA